MEGKDCFFGVVSRAWRLIPHPKFNRLAAVAAVRRVP